ncbi:MAG: GNAT family N-acetyltransferase [Bacteroidales bacterium]
MNVTGKKNELKIIKTNSKDNDFKELVKLLDAELAVLDGDEHEFYAQFNKIDKLKNAIVLYFNGRPAGCGAIKKYDAGSMEIKRMYVRPELRNKGLATKILTELENWTNELSCSRCVLETGKRQPDAIALYKKNGYVEIPNYGQYAEMENSVCFEKKLV